MEELTRIAGELVPHVVRRVVLGAWIGVGVGAFLMLCAIAALAGAAYLWREDEGELVWALLVASLGLGFAGAVCLALSCVTLAEPIGAAVKLLAR